MTFLGKPVEVDVPDPLRTFVLHQWDGSEAIVEAHYVAQGEYLAFYEDRPEGVPDYLVIAYRKDRISRYWETYR